MLKDIKFLDHTLQSCEYQEGVFLPEKGGSLNFKVERIEQFTNEKSEEKNNSFYFEDICLLEIKAENETDDSDQKLAFSLKAKVQLIYDVPENLRSQITDQSFSEEYKWYFENIGHLICHQVASSIINKTAFDKIMDIVPRYPNNNENKDEA